MANNDVHPTIADLLKQLEAGEITSVELTRKALEAARASDKLFITVDDEGALKAAEESDARRQAGESRGVLDGIPTAVKDVIDTAGLRTTMASEFFRDNVPETDAFIVAKLREAGAVIVGKTNAQEFSYGIRGDVGAFGVVRNPHDPERVPGGSSSGSAAAVAQGIVPFAVGSDTAGSIRLPAALCGVVGLKPTLGLIDTAGAFPLSDSFDTLGFFATTVDDIVLVMRATGFLDDAQPSASGFLALVDVRAQVVDAPAGEPYDHAMFQLGALPADLPQFDGRDIDFAELYRIVRSREAYDIHAERAQTAPEKFQPEILGKVLEGRDISDDDYAAAQAEIARFRELFEASFGEGDVLVSPSTPILAPRFTDPGPSRELASMTNIWNVLGWPAIALPMWVDGCALPQSVQLIARPGQDALLLAAARDLTLGAR
ncbi:amidase [Gulosibacter massiliensis]|uniref:amidase n=1 Tax=Gulosibacter massiliensis TaxID=2479839 RepID=UPI0013DDE5B9|nr:amidase [Gulosibacter massiliensis]